MKIALILTTIFVGAWIIRRIRSNRSNRRAKVYDLTRTTSLRLRKGKIITKNNSGPKYPTKQQLDALCGRIAKELIND